MNKVLVLGITVFCLYIIANMLTFGALLGLGYVVATLVTMFVLWLLLKQEMINMKYAALSIVFVFPVAVGFAENALIWYNLIAGVVCWVLSVYSFCK